MYINDISKKTQYQLITIQCEKCCRNREIQKRSARDLAKLHDGCHPCGSCSSKLSPKPQNSLDFWTKDQRQKHSISIKSSNIYYDSLSERNKKLSGSGNGMFGKSHSKATKTAMSKARVGKTGENATAWKGGKSSLVRRVKGILHTRFHWYERVYARDNWKCTVCGTGKNLDAHHIIPISSLVTLLLKNIPINQDELEYLINTPEIADHNLKNGITLCRTHHKEAHYKWGSHVAISK